MTLIIENRYSGLKHHAKVHSFRIITVILAWVLIAAAFYEKPELLTGLQRAVQRGLGHAAIVQRVIAADIVLIGGGWAAENGWPILGLAAAGVIVALLLALLAAARVRR